MKRSRRFVFVAFCVISQGVRAEGIVKKFPAIIKPVINLLIDYDINIIQMPCPELHFDTFHRKPCGKSKYDNPRNRSICRRLGEEVVSEIELLRRNDCVVEAIIGINNSPSCAVDFFAAPPPKRKVKGEGIYIEELKEVLKEHRIKIPTIGIQIYRIEETIKELEELLNKNKK